MPSVHDLFHVILSLNIVIPVLNDSPNNVREDFATRIRQRIMSRRPPTRQAKEICYDMIGCFDIERKRGLKKTPQSPDTVDTKFWLYTRDRASHLFRLHPDQIQQLQDAAEPLRYDDSETLRNSSFNPNKPIKVLIHGFKGSGKDKGALGGAQEFLLLDDVNVILVDWEKGASDSYPTAAANTELIGRQTAVLLLEMINQGAQQKNIHIVGFSLGAHIAGCAGDMVKKGGYKVGRITGLDPASPLFKHQFLRESSTKLDASDADFVDVIHTDGSPVFTDGFGLLRPIGHVDFFPNGGREQPGCNDGRGSVVVSTLEGTINSSVACSHVRAWQLFVESLVHLQQDNGCQFIAYPCIGGMGQFSRSQCFVQPLDRCLPGDSRCNVMGMGAYENGARGVLYLSTRDSKPYCGEQLQANVRIGARTQNTRGYLHMRMTHGNHSTNFRFNHELADSIKGNIELSAHAVAERGTISNAITPRLNGFLSYQSLEFQNTQPNADVFIDSVNLIDQHGYRWISCGQLGEMMYIEDTSFSTLPVNLSQNFCN